MVPKDPLWEAFLCWMQSRYGVHLDNYLVTSLTTHLGFFHLDLALGMISHMCVILAEAPSHVLMTLGPLSLPQKTLTKIMRGPEALLFLQPGYKGDPQKSWVRGETGAGQPVRPVKGVSESGVTAAALGEAWEGRGGANHLFLASRGRAGHF